MRQPNTAPSNQRDQPGHCGDKHQLSDLDADVEEKKSHRDMALWQAHLVQCAGKTQAVEQSERECYNPGCSRGQSLAALTRVHDFHGNKHNAQGNYGLDWFWRHLNKAQRRQSERDAMRQRESRDGFHQQPRGPRDDEQGQDEKQMIGAGKDMLIPSLR